MRKLLAHIAHLAGRRGLGSPRPLPTVTRRGGSLAWAIGGTAGFILLMVLGAWLDIDGEERRLQQQLDEHATWIGGVLEGRAAERRVLLQQIDGHLAEAYQRGWDDGCAGAATQPQRLMVRP